MRRAGGRVGATVVRAAAGEELELELIPMVTGLTLTLRLNLSLSLTLMMTPTTPKVEGRRMHKWQVARCLWVVMREG